MGLRAGRGANILLDILNEFPSRLPQRKSMPQLLRSRINRGLTAQRVTLSYAENK